MKLCIITGGSKGLGSSLCKQFLNKDYQVIEFSRSAPQTYSVHADFANPQDVRQIVVQTLEQIDIRDVIELIFINNAGTLNPIGLTSTKASIDVLENIHVNFVSAILVITEVIKKFQFVSCRKTIVNISSGAARKGYYGWSLYCGAKAGLENFIHSLALEQQTQLHPFIPINVNPGVIDTEMQAMIRETSNSDFVEVERFIKRKNDGQLVHPDKVATAIVKIIESDISFGNLYNTSEYM